MLRLSSFLIFCLLLVSCVSKRYTDVRIVRAVGISHNIFGLKNAGYVTAKDCAWSFFGIPLGQPSFEEAFENAVSLKKSSFSQKISEEFSEEATLSRSKVKLLTNIQTRDEGWNALIIGKKCIKFRAIAYR